MAKAIANISSAATAQKSNYGQYFTPKAIASFMLALSGVGKEASVLEPSCGKGVFLEVLQEAGFDNITAYEVDETLATNFEEIRYQSFVSANIEQNFDLIIGNPPYIRWKNLERELKAELASSELWQKHCNSLCDYLYIFLLKSIALLRDEGELIFICPEYWINTTHAQKLREYMVVNGNFECIYHLGEMPIFSNARVSLMIFKYIKSASQQKTPISIVKYLKTSGSIEEMLAALVTDKALDEVERFHVEAFRLQERWILADKDSIAKLNRFEQACAIQLSDEPRPAYHCLGDICHIGNGMVSGLDKAFQLKKEQELTAEEQAHTIKVAKAKHLKPYTYTDTIDYIFLPELWEEGQLVEGFPHFYAQLKALQGPLERRYQYNRQINYWEWVFLRNYTLFSQKKPRILVPCKERISNKSYFRFSYAPQGVWPTQDVAALLPKEVVKENIYYILAFLNNHRVFHWLNYKGILKGGIVEFSEKPLSSIPFRKIDWNKEKEVAIHDKIALLSCNYIKHPQEKIREEIDLLFDDLLA